MRVAIANSVVVRLHLFMQCDVCVHILNYSNNLQSHQKAFPPATEWNYSFKML